MKEGLALHASNETKIDAILERAHADKQTCCKTLPIRSNGVVSIARHGWLMLYLAKYVKSMVKRCCSSETTLSNMGIQTRHMCFLPSPRGAMLPENASKSIPGGTPQRASYSLINCRSRFEKRLDGPCGRVYAGRLARRRYKVICTLRSCFNKATRDSVPQERLCGVRSTVLAIVVSCVRGLLSSGSHLHQIFWHSDAVSSQSIPCLPN